MNSTINIPIPAVDGEAVEIKLRGHTVFMMGGPSISDVELAPTLHFNNPTGDGIPIIETGLVNFPDDVERVFLRNNGEGAGENIGFVFIQDLHVKAQFDVARSESTAPVVINATFDAFNQNSTGASNLSSLAVPAIAGVDIGSLLTIVAVKDSVLEDFTVADAGWTTETLTDTGNNLTFLVARKIAVLADQSATDYTLSWTSLEKCSALIFESKTNGGYRDKHTSENSGDTFSTPSPTVPVAGSMVVIGFAQRGLAPIITEPGTPTNVSLINTTGGGAVQLKVMRVMGVPASFSDTYSFELDVPQPTVSFSIVIDGTN